MNKYLKNRYVLIGLVGIAFYLYKRRQILKQTPRVSKPIEELEEKSNFTTKESKKADPSKMADKLVSDVEKMDNKTLKRTIETNEGFWRELFVRVRTQRKICCWESLALR